MKKQVLIVGGGFAGIQLAQTLSPRDFNVTLIDKVNHHQFQPLFYQVATSQIEPSSISFPLRHVLKGKPHIQIRLAEVLRVNAVDQTVLTSTGTFTYDYLVLANGCSTNYFANTELQKHVFPLKSTYDAIEIRNHILQIFETSITLPVQQKKGLLTIVIVGGGPTGVELAGAFAEIKHEILPKDYPGINFADLKIMLIEGSHHTLNNMSDLAKKTSQSYLEKMGVQVVTQTFVKHYDGQVLTLSTGDVIDTKTVIWSAGVIGNKIEGLDDITWTPTNRLKVNRFNQVIGCNHIYAVGDIALMETPNYPKGHPQLANVAINQAKLLAQNLSRLQKQLPLKPYEYKDLGSMATIGRNKAVVDLPFLSFKGYFAWLVWMFLHLMLILSVRNKLIIFINWSWAYITRNSALRLILRPNSK